MADKRDYVSAEMSKKLMKLTKMFNQWAKDNDKEDMLKGKQDDLGANMLIYLITDNKIKGL